MNLTTEEVYELFLQCTSVTTDSRNCPAGSLFFALKGTSFNGNAFASNALAAGSKFAIVDEPQYANGKNIFLVDNCLQMLQAVARLHRQTLKTTVIGITGTNGKTTTKELVAAVLQKKYNLLYTQGNLNNQIGVPLTLLRMNKGHELAVVEMGASHPGDIKELVDIALPDYGLITNVGHAHILGFGSFEGVVKTKGELYDFIRAKGGKIFRNADNSILASISEGLDAVLYGVSESNYVHARSLGASPFLKVEWNGTVIQTHLIGDYNFENVMAAIAVGSFFGVPSDAIISALEDYLPSNNRSQFKDTGKNHLIIDAYNANPTSMQAALNNFAAMDVKDKMLILGDMKELGPDSEMEHKKVVDWIKHHDFHLVCLVGGCFDAAAKGSFNCFPDVDALNVWLQQHPVSGANILVKGSNSTKLIKVVDFL
ncbi:MAG: UDP-N-acetylmuramoyl-tripeptide--D-alanyl-D-alanine ligase [Paludibacteraceae bacterium]|nr:UDP-N-acetylmuramoyl-tripeptide--D-alanyl-D-alanine ligase [Paludibacteraceae bacterium]